MVLSKISEDAATGTKYTKTGFSRVFTGKFKNYGRRKLENLIDQALLEGELILVPGTNDQNRKIEWLERVSDADETL